MIFWGVDPGATGALGIISDAEFVGVEDWPGDEVALVDRVRRWLDLAGLPRMCVVEAQQAMGQGFGAAMLKLGRNHGQWLGVLAALGVPVAHVRPVDWKKGYVAAKAQKCASLGVARRLFPGAPLTRAKDDGRAEALLLADYARKTYGGQG